MPLARDPSPADTFSRPRVSEKTAVRVVELVGGVTGLNRITGRVALALRSPHFQSSLMMLPLSSAAGYASWIVLSSVLRLTCRMLRLPDCTATPVLNAGRKVV